MKTHHAIRPSRHVLCPLVAASALLLAGSPVRAEAPPASAPAASSAAPVASPPEPAASSAAPATPAAPVTSPAASSVRLPVSSASLPAGPGPVVASEPRYHSQGLRITGFVLGGVGFLGIINGGVLILVGQEKEKDCSARHVDCGGDLLGPGMLTLLVGLSTTALGVTLSVVGSRPRKTEAAFVLPESVSIGPGSATLRWSF